jgi:uncharacterized ferritin-like protein (DUF455 family)
MVTLECDDCCAVLLPFCLQHIETCPGTSLRDLAAPMSQALMLLSFATHMMRESLHQVITVGAVPSALQHIENWAVDLSWDIIARFGSDPSYQLPREFFDDFVQVG